MQSRYKVVFLFIFIPIFLLQAQTGKISGVVKDAATGEPLISASVMIQGTNAGAASNLDGYYAILNVPPGTYTIKASMIGYTSSTLRNIRVSINQTFELNISLKEESIQAQEVIVVASAPVVQKDVSNSVVNIGSAEFENLPVANVTTVVGLQAGIVGGAFRGGSTNETGYMLNGMVMRDERNNTPFTGISFTSVEEIQIQTGGFNAEYGNIRSGLVNIVTKEGKNDRYSINVFSRVKPAGKKYFGDGPSSADAYWIRPYVDDAVAWTGTNNGAWDPYTLKQYPGFEGWNSISQKLISDNNPDNDLTPEAAQRLFLFQHRKDLRILRPDYDLDMSIAGPVPGGQALGNLRFLASFRASQSMYIIPLSTDAYLDYTGNIKLTADLTTTQKLSVEGLMSESDGTAANRDGSPGLFTSSAGIVGGLYYSRTSYGDTRIFSSDYWAPSIIKRRMLGSKYTNVLSNTSFLEGILSIFQSQYFTYPGRSRNNAYVYEFAPGLYTDEAPFGFEDSSATGIGSNMRMGVGMSNARDTSKVTTYNLRLDYTNQLDKYNNIKTGVEFNLTDNFINYGSYDKYLPSNNSVTKWHTQPLRGSIYFQDKIEFEGMIANVGVRVDYSNPNADWYILSDPYDKSLTSKNASSIDALVTKDPATPRINVSPRLGVAFPITETSKLYFNYGFFRQMPTPENLYRIRTDNYTGRIDRLSDPNLPLQKTIAYELGYEQGLFDEYLIRVAGYYKNITEQQRSVHYISKDNSVDYYIPKNDSYADTRGVEFTVTKNRGNWVQGFANYTYSLETSGFFNYSTYYENLQLQLNYLRTTAEGEQSKPVPRPFARVNLDLFTPSQDFGPEFEGIGLLTDWRVSVIGSWRLGSFTTWTGGSGSIPGISNNVQWVDSYGLDLRISKNIKFGPVNLQVFADVNNALNIKSLSSYGFIDANDYYDYMRSLHLPASAIDESKGKFGYNNINGNDKPGNYRQGPFVPIVPVTDFSTVTSPNTSAIYYLIENGHYLQFDGDTWMPVPDDRLKEVMDKKLYIDMPNQSWASFLNPRNIYWGLKISVELK
ncbi:MAG: TonB-dependent receptor [Ignavibacteria bacterium CG22_combo_CG10-13_8_21_14_all_37_15]|nr:MAG: TonB-dependent receptor [Ignavibacteria bacterium CG22_combo_CG10-13_8_21_14_all_37_15]